MTDEKKAIEQAMEAAVAELKAKGNAPAEEAPAEAPKPEAEVPKPETAEEPKAEPKEDKPPEIKQTPKKPKAAAGAKTTGKKPADKKPSDKKSAEKKPADKKSTDKKSAAAALKELAKVRRNKIIGITAAAIAIMVGIFLIAHGAANREDNGHGGAPVVLEDGTKEYPDGTKEYTDGAMEAPDGTLTLADGTIVDPDGTVTSPDGTVKAPDGTVTMPDGTVMPPASVSPGDTNVTNVQADNGGTGGEAETPWSAMTDGDYQVSIRRLNAYNGPFFEDGSDEDVSNVLALQFRNDGEQDIQYAEYVFDVHGAEVIFKMTNIPAGQSCIVLAADKHPYNANEVLKLKSRLVAAVDMLETADDQILLVNNGDNTVSILNMTDQVIPVARVFYKSYYPDQDTFVGGITYTIEIKNIPANGSSGAVEPQHFESDMSVFVGSGVYES